MRNRYLTSAIVAAMLTPMAPVMVTRNQYEHEPEPKLKPKAEPNPVTDTPYKPHQGRREMARRVRQMAKNRGTP